MSDEHSFITETVKIGWRFSAGYIPTRATGYWIELEGADGSILLDMDRVQMKAIYDRIGSLLAGD